MTESSPSSDFLCMEKAAPSSRNDSLFDYEAEEVSVVVFIGCEKSFAPQCEYHSRLTSSSAEVSDRESSIAWMIKVLECYGFQALTVYLAVNYMDRFLSTGKLPKEEGWPMQLLSLACLSLAVKMEETVAPSLRDLQIEIPKYVFEGKAVRRMELVILNQLDWRLRSVTPFNFLEFFAHKVDLTGEFAGYLKLRASQIILATVRESRFLLHLPSSIAVSAVLCAAMELPKVPQLEVEEASSWCDGLCKENIAGCYDLMKGLRVSRKRKADD